MKLIDTHCHLSDEKFSDVGYELDLAKKAGVDKVIMPSASLMDAGEVVKLAEKYDQFCLTGIHPEEIENIKNLNSVIMELREIVKSSKRVVGIGEIGLDFYWDKEKKTKEDQVELFIKQMNLAGELGLPVAVHMREAEEEMRQALAEVKTMPSGQFHCFAGSEEFMFRVLEMGFYISFCGNITYKSAGRLRELLKKVPLNRLLLETDSPYLPPEPLRGTVNRPANVKIEAEFVAQELGMTLEQIADATSENARCLYSLDT